MNSRGSKLVNIARTNGPTAPSHVNGAVAPGDVTIDAGDSVPMTIWPQPRKECGAGGGGTGGGSGGGNGSGNGSCFGSTVFTPEEEAAITAALRMKLGPEYISYRAAPGNQKLAYVEGWKYIELANETFGFNGWSSAVTSIATDFVDESNGRINMGVTAIVRVQLKDGAFHEDVGYGTAENVKSRTAAFEKAKKEAVTDGLKRALRMFGSGLGNCVTDKSYLQRISRISGVEQEPLDETLLRRPLKQGRAPAYVNSHSPHSQPHAYVSAQRGAPQALRTHPTAGMGPPPVTVHGKQPGEASPAIASPAVRGVPPPLPTLAVTPVTEDVTSRPPATAAIKPALSNKEDLEYLIRQMDSGAGDAIPHHVVTSVAATTEDIICEDDFTASQCDALLMAEIPAPTAQVHPRAPAVAAQPPKAHLTEMSGAPPSKPYLTPAVHPPAPRDTSSPKSNPFSPKEKRQPPLTAVASVTSDAAGLNPYSSRPRAPGSAHHVTSTLTHTDVHGRGTGGSLSAGCYIPGLPGPSPPFENPSVLKASIDAAAPTTTPTTTVAPPTATTAGVPIVNPYGRPRAAPAPWESPLKSPLKGSGQPNTHGAGMGMHVTHQQQQQHVTIQRGDSNGHTANLHGSVAVAAPATAIATAAGTPVAMDHSVANGGVFQNTLDRLFPSRPPSSTPARADLAASAPDVGGGGGALYLPDAKRQRIE